MSFWGPVIPAVDYDPPFREKEDPAPSSREKERPSLVDILISTTIGVTPPPKKPKD